LRCSMLYAPCFMIIGIDASRAFRKNKTGIEEYSYQIIKHLRNNLKEEQVILYLDPRVNKKEYVDFDLPEKWIIKFLRAPIFWTQIRLTLEMLFHPVDILFVPAHTIPILHPKKSFVTIHGLEYEFCPRAYSYLGKLYMRWVIRNSCRWAKRIIAVSENTKRDLIRMYKVPEEKIEVIYNGISEKNPNIQCLIPNKISNTKYEILNTKYILFIGRLEERKNICGIIEAFEILKEKYNLPHKLVLAGNFGYGDKEIRNKIENSKYKEEIILAGYIKDEEKWELLKRTDVFLFPTFYEGFGLPIIEAQSVSAPVITSNISSMPEVAGKGAILVDPKNPEEIAKAAHRLITDKELRDDIIEKGLENVKRFSWDKCAREAAKLILGAEGRIG
jgi:glycosyltransferase involved in cell wall biosynthesis